MQKTKEIEKVAFELGEHPIHIKMFLLHCKKCLEKFDHEEVIDEYNKFKKNAPKPFVKWVGGKRQLLQQFRSRNLYPPEDFNPNTSTYFEPFVGGGAMFFDIKPKEAFLSDMNFELITTYNVIKSDVENLIKKLKYLKGNVNKEYFLKIRKKDIEKLSSLDMAARFIYLNRTCFNGMFRVNSRGQFNVPYGKNSNPMICDEDNLRKVSKSLKNIKIIHEDYKEVLNRAKKGDFVYFDPPYYPVNKTSSFTSYTKEAFLEKEQMELSSTFLELHNRGCYVMLSNSNTPFIKELYSNLSKDIKIKKVYATRAINSVGKKRGEIRELVIVNY